LSPQGQREPEVLILTCFEPRQQSQRIVTADSLEIVHRKTELHNAFSRFGEGYEGIIAAKQDLCGRDQTLECRNRWSIGSTGDIATVAFQLVFDSVGCLFGDILGTILVHATQRHRHVAARVGKDEPNVLESRKCSGKQQIRNRPSGILWDFNEYGRNIRQQCSTAQRCCRMYKHNGFAAARALPAPAIRRTYMLDLRWGWVSEQQRH